MIQLTRTKEDLSEKAAEWLALLHEQDSQELREDFVAWLRLSADHVEAVLRTTAGFRLLLEHELAAANVANTSVTGIESPREQSDRGRYVRVHRYAPPAGAVVGLIVVTAMIWWMWYRAVIGGTGGVSTTTYSQADTYHLRNASTMTLYERSKVKVRPFNGGKGVAVWVVEGDAEFSGRHDPDHPLRVFAGRTIIDVAGTVFSVHQDAEVTRVSVKDGKVLLSSTCDSPEAQPFEETNLADVGTNSATPVTSGHVGTSPTHDCDGSLEVRALKEVHARAHADSLPEWVYFKGMTVYDAVEVFNRYNSQRLAVSDPALASRRIGGGFRTTDFEGFIVFLQRQFGATVTRTVAPDGSQHIVLGAATHK